MSKQVNAQATAFKGEDGTDQQGLSAVVTKTEGSKYITVTFWDMGEVISDFTKHTTDWDIAVAMATAFTSGKEA